MSDSLSFSQLLRPVGQMLEPLQVESFSLKVEEGGIAVFAEKQENAQPARPDISLKVSWQIFRRKKSDAVQDPQPTSGTLELHYSHDDIARMDAQGQEKRTGSPGSPEAHTLSQILRAVGAFVDQKQGRLVSVVKDGQEITIAYESALKRPLTDKFTVASLYDYWVKMYLRRRDRS
jgi:hypothetical protein